MYPLLFFHFTLCVSFYLAFSFRPVESPWGMGPGTTEMEGHLDYQDSKDVAHFGALGQGPIKALRMVC